MPCQWTRCASLHRVWPKGSNTQTKANRGTQARFSARGIVDARSLSPTRSAYGLRLLESERSSSEHSPRLPCDGSCSPTQQTADARLHALGVSPTHHRTNRLVDEILTYFAHSPCLHTARPVPSATEWLNPRSLHETAESKRAHVRIQLQRWQHGPSIRDISIQYTALRLRGTEMRTKRSRLPPARVQHWRPRVLYARVRGPPARSHNHATRVLLYAVRQYARRMREAERRKGAEGRGEMGSG